MPIFDDDDIDTSYDLSNSEHVTDIRSQAMECISHFFEGKSYWAGGSIPKSKLYKEEHIKAVMEMTVMDALAVAYYCLESAPPDTVRTAEKGWDMALCYECLKQCASRWIPKCFAGGMLLVYLRVCHGVDYVPVLKKLAEIRTAIQERERLAEIRALARQQE